MRRYAGVGVNAKSIAWLTANVEDPRFKFIHINDLNALYNPQGVGDADLSPLTALENELFDAACMYSVVTHLQPHEARAASLPLFATSCAGTAGLEALLNECGRKVSGIYEKLTFQAHAVACDPR